MYKTLTATLKKSGLRLTATRLAICKYLAETEEHPTASVIYQNLKGQYPSLSLATVYNTLDVLVDMGAINVLGQTGDGNVHFDPKVYPHINLACLKCHRIIDYPSDDAAHMQEVISRDSGFKLVGSRIMYYGICPDCQTNEANKLQIADV